MEVAYFLDIIKKNAVLYSILINGNFSQLHLDQNNISVWSERAVEIRKIVLGEDTLEVATIVIYDTFILMDFSTTDSKFFTNSKKFFGKEGLVRYKAPYLMNEISIEEEYKNFGIVDTFAGPASITVRHFNKSQYVINVRFYNKQVKRKNLEKPSYFIKGTPIAQEALFLFKPNEITLIPTFTPFYYAPQVEILVKNPEHPFVKYLEHKAFLSYRGKLYDHRKIPKIDPSSICGLSFVERREIDDDIPNENSILIVNLCERSTTYQDGGFTTSFEVISPEVNFFKIENEILTVEELKLSRLNLDKDYTLVKTLFGKEAVDEFANLEYAQGISVYVLK